MKKLELSRLMDDYRDTEFFPKGEGAADVQAVKARVLAQAAPAGKVRRFPVKRLLLAAALAAVCVVLIAAGVPTRVVQLASGGTLTVEYQNTSSSPQSYAWTFAESPIVLKDGRLWLEVYGEERIDITDLIDEQTPYIYDNTDPEVGLRDYLVVGGTPEDFGWVEYYEAAENNFAAGGGSNTYTVFASIDGEIFTEDELTPEQQARTQNYVMNNDEGVIMWVEPRPWVSAALAELDINRPF